MQHAHKAAVILDKAAVILDAAVGARAMTLATPQKTPKNGETFLGGFP